VTKPRKTDADRSLEILQNLLITTLSIAGVPQLEVRKIVGVDMARVNRIARHLKPRKG